MLVAVLVFVGQKGCIPDNIATTTSIQRDEPTIKANIIRKTNIDWEAINVDTSNALSVSLERAYPQDLPENRSAVDKTKAQQLAIDFLIFLKDELGISGASEIAIDEARIYKYTEQGYAHRDYSITIRYHQNYSGVPVYDSFGLMSMTKYGEVYRLKNIWYPDVVAPIVPVVSKVAIKQTAMAHYKVDNIDFFEEPKLNVLPPDKLIWWVKMGEPVHKDALMDALTGVVLSEWDNLMTEALPR